MFHNACENPVKVSEPFPSIIIQDSEGPFFPRHLQLLQYNWQLSVQMDPVHMSKYERVVQQKLRISKEESSPFPTQTAKTANAEWSGPDLCVLLVSHVASRNLPSCGPNVATAREGEAWSPHPHSVTHVNLSGPVWHAAEQHTCILYKNLCSPQHLCQAPKKKTKEKQHCVWVIRLTLELICCLWGFLAAVWPTWIHNLSKAD